MKAPEKRGCIPVSGTLYSVIRNGRGASCSPKRAQMPQPEFMQGLQRGLQVMQLLQTTSTASLNEIHRATRISKPSLLRILRGHLSTLASSHGDWSTAGIG